MGIVRGTPVPTTESSNVPLLPPIEKRTRPKFALVVHPQQWAWDAEAGTWLPRLSKFLHDPGVNGVGYDSATKRLDTSEGERMYRQKGYLIFDDGDARLISDVLPDGKFVSRFDAHGGTAYGWAWEGFEIVGNEVYWEEDRDQRRAFQQHLIESNLIKPMHPRLIDQEIKRAAKRMERIAARVTDQSPPALRMRLAAAETLHKAMCEARDTLMAPPAEPAPKRSSRSSK